MSQVDTDMVKERGEPLLPPFPCNSPYAFQRRPTLIRFCARHVLCWSTFPLAPALRSTGSAAFASADASTGGSLRFVRRLHRYYGEVRLLGPCIVGYGSSPSRCGPSRHKRDIAARRETSQVPMRSLCT